MRESVKSTKIERKVRVIRARVVSMVVDDEYGQETSIPEPIWAVYPDFNRIGEFLTQPESGLFMKHHTLL